jgi:2-polyprenyl-3-methyl-5-hydroxy-6-metoxy-1,4-benzoquinol methylase
MDRELGADDYSYLLPDHWLLPADDPFTVMHQAYVRRVVEIVKTSGATTVLEAGCGDGWNCGKLAEAGLQVVGVDWSKHGIDHARRMVKGARFHCGDVREGSFRSAFPDPFDAVIFVEVLEHIPPRDCVDALRQISAPLKPDGTFVLTTPSVNKPNHNPQHYRHFDVATLRAVIADAGGLSVESIEGYGDVREEDRHWRLRRWVDNRFWTIKPACRRLLDRYARRCSNTSLEDCHGYIVSMRKVG